MFGVSHVNSVDLHIPTYPKNDYWCGLSVSELLERMVRFLTTVDVVLEEYNNCLPNKKWLGDQIFWKYLGKFMLNVHY